MKLHVFRTVPLSIIRSLFTVHSAMVYVIQVCRRAVEQEHMLLLDSCLQTYMTYSIAECTLNKLLMMDRGTIRNMWSFMPEHICGISASSWFYYKER
jgi:hypothetical protein